MRSSAYSSSGYRTDLHKRSATRVALLLTLVVAVLLAGSARGRAQAQGRQLHIAAAADLQPVLPALAAEYRRATGVELIASFGSSATLTEQIRNGAPQDIFLSADTVHPQQLTEAGLTEGPPVPYARGVLVLWARKDSPAQPLRLESLSAPQVTRVAIANPAHAPYGLAAQAAIGNLHLTEMLAPKLVTAENIAQTAQFALSGNAQVAFISLTLASSPSYRKAGSFIRLPAVYPAIQQSGVVLKQSSQLADARAFLQWLTEPGTQQRLSTFGLEAVR